MRSGIEVPQRPYLIEIAPVQIAPVHSSSPRPNSPRSFKQPPMMNTALSTSNQLASGKLASGKLASGKLASGKLTSQKLAVSPNPLLPQPEAVPLKSSSPITTVKSSLLQSPTHSSVSHSSVPETPIQRLDNHLMLLQGVVEGLPDGILILTHSGELTYENSCARRICRQLLATSEHMTVPTQIWHCCHTLIERRHQFHPTVIIEDEILTEAGITIRIRVRWLDPNNLERPLLLVTLEDQQQSAQYRAYAEAQRYGLTDRETEVWLLKRAGLTYKAIAAKLFIAEDTVKKHIKNIHARRDAAQWANG